MSEMFKDKEERGARGFNKGDKKKKRGKKKMGFRKKRPPATLSFDYKDLSSMFPFLTEEGKLVAARVSGLRSFQQRELTLAVKRARHLAFVGTTTRDTIH